MACRTCWPGTHTTRDLDLRSEEWARCGYKPLLLLLHITKRHLIRDGLKLESAACVFFELSPLVSFLLCSPSLRVVQSQQSSAGPRYSPI